MLELIDEGVTGFTVTDDAAAVAAVESAAALDRTVVRSVAERRFSAERMVDDYLAIYRDLLDR
jgi:glycosyltransferase involved in cell wall biosynthesis